MVKFLNWILLSTQLPSTFWRRGDSSGRQALELSWYFHSFTGWKQWARGLPGEVNIDMQPSTWRYFIVLLLF